MMPSPVVTQFGFYPEEISLHTGPIRISTLPDLARKVDDLLRSPHAAEGWIYSPPQNTRQFTGEIIRKPFPARVFGLPKTHAFEHSNADNNEHISFHLWALSFFTGMRLTNTEAGFLDATPVYPGKLVDFVLMNSTLGDAIVLSECFWTSNRNTPLRATLIGSAIHALFLSQYVCGLPFEEFIYLYTSFDACFALAKSFWPTRQRIRHEERISWMCRHFNMPTPQWATAHPGQTAVATIRNKTLHEALFFDEPLGFAIPQNSLGKNLTLEMKALVCRFIVALLGATNSAYVFSPIDTGQRHGLDL